MQDACPSCDLCGAEADPTLNPLVRLDCPACSPEGRSYHRTCVEHYIRLREPRACRQRKVGFSCPHPGCAGRINKSHDVTLKKKKPSVVAPDRQRPARQPQPRPQPRPRPDPRPGRVPAAGAARWTPPREPEDARPARAVTLGDFIPGGSPAPSSSADEPMDHWVAAGLGAEPEPRTPSPGAVPWAAAWCPPERAPSTPETGPEPRLSPATAEALLRGARGVRDLARHAASTVSALQSAAETAVVGAEMLVARCGHRNRRGADDPALEELVAALDAVEDAARRTAMAAEGTAKAAGNMSGEARISAIMMNLV